MKGLDNWIMGVNDPNAPFNQIDWVEEYEPILDKCQWVTETMLENDNTYRQLGNIISEIVTKRFDDKYYSSKEKYQIIKDESVILATEFEQKWNQLNNPKN